MSKSIGSSDPIPEVQGIGTQEGIKDEPLTRFAYGIQTLENLSQDSVSAKYMLRSYAMRDLLAARKLR
jgi:hypothetical protein